MRTHADTLERPTSTGGPAGHRLGPGLDAERGSEVAVGVLPVPAPELLAPLPASLDVDPASAGPSPWRRPVVWGPAVAGLVLVVVAVVLLVGGSDDSPPADPKPKGPQLQVAKMAGAEAYEVTWKLADPVRQLWVLTESQPPQDGTTLVRGTKAIVPAALLDGSGGCFALTTTVPEGEAAASTTTTAAPDAEGGLTPLDTGPTTSEPLDLEGFDAICTRGLSLDAVRRR